MYMFRRLLPLLSGIAVGLLIVGLALFLVVASRSTAQARSNPSIASSVAIHASHGAPSLPVHQTGGLPPADQVAIQYVVTHYPGKGQARVLETEADVDRGVAVYDVRVLAPNGTMYVVHVQRSNTAVLWVNRAESQTLSAVDD